MRVRGQWRVRAGLEAVAARLDMSPHALMTMATPDEIEACIARAESMA